MKMTEKQTIEEGIDYFLVGENLSRALGFIAYLKHNKVNIQGTNKNTWKAVKKGVALCYIKMGVDTIPHSIMQRELKYNSDMQKGSWVIYPHIHSIEDRGLRVTAEDKCIEKRDGYEGIISDDRLFNRY